MKQLKFTLLALLAGFVFSLKTVAAPIAVATEMIKVGPISTLAFAQGHSYAKQREYLLFEAPGKVVSIGKNAQGGTLQEGDLVRKGDVLARLDSKLNNANLTLAKANMDLAQLNLANARKELDRAERLKQGGAISQSQYEMAVTAHNQALIGQQNARTQMQQAEITSEQLQLIAPFDGKLAFVNIRVGQYVNPAAFDGSSSGSAVATAAMVLIDSAQFEMVAELPAFESQQLKVGQPVYILDDMTLAYLQQYGYPDSSDQLLEHYVSLAQVSAVSPALNPQTRNRRFRAVTNQGTQELMDGARVNMWVEIESQQQAVIMPTTALIYEGDNVAAFVVDTETQRVSKRKLELGIESYDGIEVLAGVKAGELVVTKGRYRLVDGMSVNLIQEMVAESE